MRRATNPPASQFADVFETQFAYVWRTLMRFGVSSPDAEDLAQEVFVVVHRRLADFDTSRPIKPWLFGITHNVFRDHLRTTRRRPESGDPWEDSGGTDPGIRAVEAAQIVHRALRQLPEDRRAVFIGCDLAQLTLREVAEALAIPENTAWSRLRVARREFKNAVVCLMGESK